MAIPSGLGAQWCSQDEVTYGVSPTFSSPPFVILDSDTLGLKKTTKVSAGIYAGAMAPKAARRVLTEYSVQGGTVADLPARGLNKWLFRMFGSYGQSAATLAQDGVTMAYSATHTIGDITGHTFAIQKGAPDITGTVAPFTYTGCKIADWEIAATMGEIAKWNMTIEARNELGGTGNGDPLNGSVPTLQTYSAPPGGVFYWLQGQVLYGGTASTTSGVTSISAPTTAGNIKSFSLKFARPMDTTRFSPELAGWRNEPLQNGLVQVTGQFVVEWKSSAAYYNAFAGDTATALQLQFVGPVIGSGSDHSTFNLLMSNIRLEGDSVMIPGPAVLSQTVPFTAFDDGTNNVLQATYWTLDTV